MSCSTPHCTRPVIGAEVFCRHCWRLVPHEHRDAMRMCGRSPLYGSKAWAMVDGREVMGVTGEDAVDVRGVTHITRALHMIEWKLLCRELGKAVRKKLARTAARVRLAGRRGA